MKNFVFLITDCPYHLHFLVADALSFHSFKEKPSSNSSYFPIFFQNKNIYLQPQVVHPDSVCSNQLLADFRISAAYTYLQVQKTPPPLTPHYLRFDQNYKILLF